MKGIYGNMYDFFPRTFSLPNEYTKFVQAYAKDEEEGCKKLWICKPVDMSRGRGIFIIKELSHLLYDNNFVVQRYLDSPFLISGYKFDMRWYVYMDGSMTGRNQFILKYTRTTSSAAVTLWLDPLIRLSSTCTKKAWHDLLL